MNKIFKVIFNRHLNKMVVTSELARGVTRAKSEKVQSAVKASLTLAAALVLGAVSVSAGATIKDTSIGKKITISSPKGSASNYSPNGIAIGNGAYIEDMGSATKEGIAIGTNAKALDGNSTSRWFGDSRNLPGGVSGIAIGKDTYANESTVDIGAKSVKNEDKGANRRGVVSIGADSYAAAHFASINGSYSSIVTDPNKTIGGFFSGSMSSQGFATTISGSLNTVTANGENKYDGMANAITGTANVIEHSNGALIMGAGNKISNSSKDLVLSETPTFSNITDPNKLNEILNTRNEDSNKKPELGSVGIFGGGNEVDHAYFSNIQGVDNTLKGKKQGAASEFVSIEGYRNEAENVENLMNSGSHNSVTNAKENIVMGNYIMVEGKNDDRSDATRNVILGFQDKDSEKIGKNIKNNQIIGSDVTVHAGTTKGVLLGDGAEIAASNTDNTTALSGAVALGSESKADRQALDNTKVVTDNKKIAEAAKNNTVYAMGSASDTDKKAIKDTIKGDLAAVSVGNSNKTRQIINVAAGSEDTDAVNVAQLRGVANTISKNINNINQGSSGVVVYTDSDSDRTPLINVEGNWYKPTDFENGVLKTGAKPVEQNNIIASIKNVDGSTTNPTIVSNVAAGNISPTSVDAVNGTQINKLIGGEIKYDKTTKEYTFNSNKGIGGTGKNNINDAIAEINEKVSNSNSTWDLTVEDGSTSTIGKGSKVNFTSEDKNIKITKTIDSNNKVNVDLSLSDEIKLGSVSETHNGKTVTHGGTEIDKTGVNVGSVTTKEGNTVTTQNGTVVSKDGIVIGGSSVTKNGKTTVKHGTVINQDGLKIGDNGPSISISGIDGGQQKITNIARGTAPTDAVNMQQLNEVKSDVNAVDKRASAGTASAMAASGLPQAYLPGHSMVAVSAGSHRDQSAVAVGVSRISDSGHVIFKLNGVTNSKGDMSSSIGVGYQW